MYASVYVSVYVSVFGEPLGRRATSLAVQCWRCRIAIRCVVHMLATESLATALRCSHSVSCSNSGCQRPRLRYRCPVDDGAAAAHGHLELQLPCLLYTNVV